MATNYYDKFIAKLQEIFMMDHAELDFGIYRIMNQKRDEIKHFLEIDLLPQVKSILEGESGDTQSIKKRMAEIEQMFVGMDIATLPDSNPNVAEYKKLKAQLEQGGDPESMQSEVFSHLVTFFSRYYDGGDFLSKRRYKDNTYAIPYNGEEVKLHWANANQYYIKTSEYFRNYTFLLPLKKEDEPRRKVHFVLKDASTEQNNNKTANNMERRFALYKPENADEHVVEIVDGELNIYFTYELMPKATKQDALREAAVEAIKPSIPEGFEELLTVKAPTAKDPNRTLLEKHLTDYTAKNSFDYFIHKDLGGFLNRELDFYIKNEVLHIDDLDPKHINSQLAIVKAIKQVGQKIIQMLAQLENYQRRLWLKKKFVVQCDYCITLDRVPEELYQRICDNEAQRREWVRLFAIDEIQQDLHTESYSEPLTIEFLKQNPFLVLDTAFFDTKFKHQLLRSMENIDEQTYGLLINSDNYQALQLLQERYRNQLQCVYIDPPYNTSSSEIMYKNSYKHSSWLSLIQDRALLGKKLLSEGGIQCTAIDDVEEGRLKLLLEDVFEGETAVVALRVNPHGRLGTNGFSITHDYALFSRKNENTPFGLLPRDERQNARYKERDEKGAFLWFPLQKTGSNTFRKDRPTMFYPIYLNESTGLMRIPDMYYNESRQEYVTREEPANGEVIIYPIKDDGQEGNWYFGIERARKEVGEFKSVKQKDGSYTIYVKYRATDGLSPFTIWDDAKYSATEHGTALLKDIFGKQETFSYPKAIAAVEDCLRVSKVSSDSTVIDYFAGSGTTGHATINLNREDDGKRKFILCEVNDYFNSVTKPRIEKVIYDQDWKDGKPVSRQGISQCFKYIRLEQYEDTLNNLEIKKQQTEALPEEFHESYMLSYMLDTETRDSLLNLQWFENPFAMSLKTTKDNELVPTHVDMVETFNYLIGLNVETEDWYQDDNICVVQGKTHREGLKTLVIWRNCQVVDNDALCEFFRKRDFRTHDTEFDLIFVNGDNTLPNLRRDEDHWKVVLIEEEFQKRMFENE